MIIEFPVCEWCKRGGALEIYKCRSCGKWTCYDCVEYNQSDRCTHNKYTEVRSDFWNINNDMLG